MYLGYQFLFTFFDDFVYSIPTVPTAPPDNLKVTHSNSRTANLTWNPPPVEHHNGDLTGYVIQVKKILNGEEIDVNITHNGNQSDCIIEVDSNKGVHVNTTHMRISNLEPRTAYEFRVSAKTAGGIGPPAIKESTTPEASMGILFSQLWAVLATPLHRML